MRYFFDLHGALEVVDEDGHEFASLGDACREAVRSAGETIRDRPDTLCHGDSLHVEIRDEIGGRVFGMELSVSAGWKEAKNLNG